MVLRLLSFEIPSLYHLLGFLYILDLGEIVSRATRLEMGQLHTLGYSWHSGRESVLLSWTAPGPSSTQTCAVGMSRNVAGDWVRTSVCFD